MQTGGRLPPPEDIGLESYDDDQLQPPPPRHRNLALTIGGLCGIVCGIGLPILLSAYVPPFRGVLSWIVGFPVGIMGGTALMFFLLRRLIERPRPRG